MMKHRLWLGLAVVLIVVAGIIGSIRERRLMQGTSSYGEESALTAESMGGFAMDSAQSEGKMAVRSMAPGIIMPEPPMVSGGVSADIKDRMIIKTGNISMVVKDVADAVKSIMNYAIEKKGFVVSSNQDKNGLIPTGSVTMRLPAAAFDEALGALRAMGEVKSQNVTGEDVTDQYVDLDSQLRNLKATEEQFLSILRKATRIEDILAVQRELTNVRSQIEVMQGRMKYLKESAAYSTLTVYLSTDPSALPVIEDEDQWKPVAVVKEALRSLIMMGQNVVNGFIWLVVYLPLWLLLILGVWLVRRFVMKRNT